MAVLVFDSAPLCCFARAGALATLERLTAGDERVTTQAVLDELRRGVPQHPELGEVLDLPWLLPVGVDSLAELRCFAAYANRLGAGGRDIGEASVLAWAEVHGAIAFTDDQAAVQVGRERGVEVKRTLALIARAVRLSILTEPEAEQLVDALIRAGARFPLESAAFLVWARDQGLLGG